MQMLFIQNDKVEKETFPHLQPEYQSTNEDYLSNRIPKHFRIQGNSSGENSCWIWILNKYVVLSSNKIFR
jgi:hypothetical protein